MKVTLSIVLGLIGVCGLGSSAAWADLLYYDGQDISGTYGNTAFASGSLAYTMSNGVPMATTGGRRIAPGSGDPGGNDYILLNPTAGDVWDLNGLYDAGSSTIGGGNISGTIYVSALVRAQNPASGSTEPAYASFQLGRPFTTVLGMGNHWNAWAYSIFGVTGDQDMIDGAGTPGSWIKYNADVHWMVARIRFNAGANDDVTVWLDPNPSLGDAQPNEVRRYAGTAVGDASFSEIAYRAGNDGADNDWEFDEVRMGTTWNDMLVVPEPSTLMLGLLGVLALARRRR